MAQTDYTGVASSAKLVGTLAASAGAGTVVSVDNATGWPTGATGIPFVGCFDRGSSTEEKILFSSRSGNDLTVAQRGYDDTSAITHQNGAPVEHTVDATVLRTSSAHVFDTTRDDHTQYARTDMSRVLTGSVLATAASHYFGAGANGGAGTRVQLGSLGDPNNAFVVGEGSPTNVGLLLRPKGSGVVALQGAAANTVVQVNSTGLGFYGHAAVAQAATPTTLADVIAIIRGYGLSA